MAYISLHDPSTSIICHHVFAMHIELQWVQYQTGSRILQTNHTLSLRATRFPSNRFFCANPNALVKQQSKNNLRLRLTYQLVQRRSKNKSNEFTANQMNGRRNHSTCWRRRIRNTDSFKRKSKYFLAGCSATPL